MGVVLVDTSSAASRAEVLPLQHQRGTVYIGVLKALCCSGDAWEHLRTFVGILQAIATAMQKMVEGTTAESDPVVQNFGKLAESVAGKHNAFNSARQLQGG